MTSEDSSVDESDVYRVLRRLDTASVDVPQQRSDVAVRPSSNGVNDVFSVSTATSDEPHLVVKFGTHSTATHLRSGAIAYQLLETYTNLPVPTVYLTDFGDESLPPAVVMEYRPGTELAGGFHDIQRATDPAAVRLLGTVLAAFDSLPDHAASGYGFIEDVQYRAGKPHAVGEYDDCTSWFLEYAEQRFTPPPDHEAVQSVVPDVLEYLQRHSERLPTTAPHYLVITDLSPQNLLSADGTPPSDIDGLTGVIDLERAKLGPVEFTAVNVEYLLTRYISNPEPVREALYDPLPFGPDMPNRDLYRLVAIGRSVGALPFWYEPGSETYRERGDTIAAELREIVQ